MLCLGKHWQGRPRWINLWGPNCGWPIGTLENVHRFSQHGNGPRWRDTVCQPGMQGQGLSIGLTNGEVVIAANGNGKRSMSFLHNIIQIDDSVLWDNIPQNIFHIQTEYENIMWNIVNPTKHCYGSE